MASSALRRSIPRRGSLRRLLPSHPPSAATAASSFRRSFQSGEGESVNEFEDRLFGDQKGSDERPFFRKLDGAGSSFGRYGMGSGLGAFGRDRGNSGFGDRSSSGIMDGFDSLNDGMNEKLDDAARTFQMTEEVEDDDYDFRPDVNYRRGSTYNVRDLDLTKPAAPRNPPRPQFETSTKEVLRKADFRGSNDPMRRNAQNCSIYVSGWMRHLHPRLYSFCGDYSFDLLDAFLYHGLLQNVRFLANFLTEAGIIIKRNQTKISAKAQRKVAREIKTARALGLMPFTTMGKRPFIFGRSVEEDASEEEYGYDFVEQKEAGPEDDVGDAVPDVETV